MHDIDLKKYEIRTDMAIDLTEKDKKTFKPDTYFNKNVKISWITLNKDNKIGKKPGTYLTLEFSDVTDTDSKENVQTVFKEEFIKMLKKINYNKNMKTIVVGLGNIKSTPDALGPSSVEKIIVTKHLFDMKIDVDDNFANVSAFYPGVTGQTGIETSDFIKGVVEKTKPDLVIVIDSLASTSISRVNKSIQVSDCGISPGSAIGNTRKEVSFDTIGVPVIAVGVPTVVDAPVIVSDTINYMIKNYVYNKSFMNSNLSKFVNKKVNYLKYDVKINDSDKRNLLGLVGTLTEEELKDLTYEVLSPIGYNLMVTPKEVDFVIGKLSDVISYGLNHSIHNI